MESNCNSDFLDCGLGDQQKQLQKQCVRIIQATEVVGKVTRANTCLGECYGSQPPQHAERET